MAFPMRRYDDLFRGLAARFDRDEEKDLPKSAGAKAGIRYVTARTLMNRLDNVLGPENWWDDYTETSKDSVLCRLTIRLPDGSTLTKCDAGGYAPMKSEEDRVKSGYSDAFKRACYKFGIARYLYRDGSATFPDTVEPVGESTALPDSTPGPVAEASVVHHGSQGEAAPAPSESSSERTPAESKGQTVDDRNMWIYITDEVTACNSAYLAESKEEGEIVIAQEVVMHLVYLTWEAALHPFSPQQEDKDTPLSSWVQVLEGIARKSPKHKDRLRSRTREYLQEVYQKAKAKLEPKSSRGPR